MSRFDNRERLLAACLAALAGYVDALGFLHLGGFFLSFMSGNSTRLGVGLAQGGATAVTAGLLIATFVTGVVLGSLTGRVAGNARRRAVLALVAILLVMAGALDAAGVVRAAIAAMGLAMGAENAVFEEDGETRIGLTYMTGALVKIGQRLAQALVGGPRWDWSPYALLWAGLVLGALAGACIYPHLGLGGLWVAAGVAAGLAMVTKPVPNPPGPQ
ncbi:YoaK family protein [Caulobacter sp.]|uniref:YoaK family protein n=1 Tax=Caulobacter sp. TaxID=78 RepID=UPI0031D206F3